MAFYPRRFGSWSFKIFSHETENKIDLFYLLTGVVINLSCNKDKEQSPPPVVNKPPIAKAGPDTTMTVTYCGGTTNLELDGSASTDPEGSTLTYSWWLIGGGPSFAITNRFSAKTTVPNLFAGTYTLELYVTEMQGLSARDTIRITVKDPPPKEYDLDITFNSDFSFIDNYKDCYYFPCNYYDRVLLEGKGTFLPLGEFTIYFFRIYRYRCHQLRECFACFNLSWQY